MSGKDDLGPFEHRVMEFFTHRPAGEQWATGIEVHDAIRETEPRTSFGKTFTTLERLTWKDYLEAKVELLPPRPPAPKPEKSRMQRLFSRLAGILLGPTPTGPLPQPRRKYYRATSGGIRVYDNSKKASLDSARPNANQQPAPSPA